MKKHILVVDDEAPTRELVGLFFKSRGYEISTASTAAEARAKLAELPVDLVILDVNLGDDDGLALLPEVRSQSPKIPVIVFTGLAYDETVRERALALGADRFMAKTQPLAEMLREVQNALGQPCN